MHTFILRLLAVILSGISLIPLNLVLGVLFPKWVRRTEQTAQEHPRRSFLVGLVNFLFFASIALGFSVLAERASGIFFIPALFFAIPLGIGVTIGAAGMVELVGKRLFPEQGPIQRTVFSTAILYAACLTPIVGWFGLSAFLGITGLGAFVLGFFRKGEGTIETEKSADVD